MLKTFIKLKDEKRKQICMKQMHNAIHMNSFISNWCFFKCQSKTVNHYCGTCVWQKEMGIKGGKFAALERAEK
jgi:hypothetical protein